MRTRLMLQNVRHRAMITPVSPLYVIGSFKLARVTEQFIIRLKLFPNGTVYRIGIQIQCFMQIHASKKFQFDMNN